MVNCKKISTIFFSIGIISIPNIAFANTSLEIWNAGFVDGALQTACSLYRDNEISESTARSFIAKTLTHLKKQNLGEKLESLVYTSFDQKPFRSCKKFMRN